MEVPLPFHGQNAIISHRRYLLWKPALERHQDRVENAVRAPAGRAMKTEEYRGFILRPLQDLEGFRVAIAHADGRIFAMGSAFSRCFYTKPVETCEGAIAEAKARIGAEDAESERLPGSAVSGTASH